MSSSPLMTLVRSLHLGEDRTDLLKAIPARGWPELLRLADEAHIGIVLAQKCRYVVPDPVRVELDSRMRRSAVRHASVVEAHRDISAAMESRGAEFLVLKGLTHDELWHSGSGFRPQYDIDLYCPPESMAAAREAAASIGYEPAWEEDNGADHIPTLIRRTGWRWRGDYYDPDQPLALELHHRFATPGLGFRVQGADRFWNRHVRGVFGGIDLPALYPADRVTYAAGHAIRHLLRGNLRISHVYEMAHFLQRTAQDHAFWQGWRDMCPAGDRLVEAIAFRLAREWFGCSVSRQVDDCIRALPADVDRWFRLFGFSAIDAVMHPNKDELFLNLCLTGSRRERRNIVVRRIFPARVPPTLFDAHLKAGDRLSRSAQRVRRAAFIARRALHHLRTLAPVIRNGFRWWLAGSQLPR